MKTAFLRTVSAAIALAIPTFWGSQAALAQALQFELINDSSKDVYYLYVSPSSSDSWGEDLLGEDIILSGESAAIIIDDGLEGCEYDMLAVSSEEDEIEDYGLDLCEMTTYTITD